MILHQLINTYPRRDVSRFQLRWQEVILARSRSGRRGSDRSETGPCRLRGDLQRGALFEQQGHLVLVRKLLLLDLTFMSIREHGALVPDDEMTGYATIRFQTACVSCRCAQYKDINTTPIA